MLLSMIILTLLLLQRHDVAGNGGFGFSVDFHVNCFGLVLSRGFRQSSKIEPFRLGRRRRGKGGGGGSGGHGGRRIGRTFAAAAATAEASAGAITAVNHAAAAATAAAASAASSVAIADAIADGTSYSWTHRR